MVLEVKSACILSILSMSTDALMSISLSNLSGCPFHSFVSFFILSFHGHVLGALHDVACRPNFQCAQQQDSGGLSGCLLAIKFCVGFFAFPAAAAALALRTAANSSAVGGSSSDVTAATFPAAGVAGLVALTECQTASAASHVFSNAPARSILATAWRTGGSKVSLQKLWLIGLKH